MQRRDYAIITDMEPKLPSPNLGPEQSSGGYGQTERFIAQPPNPEIGFEQKKEHAERVGEASPLNNDTLTPQLPVLPAPVVSPIEPNQTSQGLPSSDDNPLVANDDDLIEKEWVDRAKKIILQTKDDPFRREQEVSRLQADYLRKRYGRELGAPE